MKEKLRSIFFVGLIISMSIFNIIKADKTFSKEENRYLEEFPKFSIEDIMSGEFGKSFEKYSTDQFIMRNAWISLKTISDLSMLKKDNSRVYFGKEGYLFDLDEKIDETQFGKSILSINAFLDKIDKINKDIDIYALLVPTKSQVLGNKLPPYAPKVNEEEIIDRLSDSLIDNIKIISLMNILNENNDEYIYYKTDHHWTSKGAFYAYKCFLESKGQTSLVEEDFKIHEVSKDFLGTSYRKANYYKGVPDSIDIYSPIKKIEYDMTINRKDKASSLYDESYLNKTDKYSYFLGGDKSIIEIDTSIIDGKAILVIKDSFANSFIPFLINHYEKIIVVDPRYFNGGIGELAQGQDIDEILFLFNTQSFVQEDSLQGLSR